MEITLRLIISLVLVVSTVAVFSAYFQVHQEKERQREELEHRSRLLASSLQEAIEPLIEKRAISNVQRREVRESVFVQVERVNWRFQSGEWRPIVFLKKHHTHQEIDDRTRP